MKKFTLIIIAMIAINMASAHDRERNSSTNPSRSEVMLSAGFQHSLFIQYGQVFAVGNNNSAQLGDGTKGGTTFIPVMVSGLDNIIAVSAGNQHSIALRADGTVWAWGSNSAGQLGQNPSSLPESLTPIPVPLAQNVIAISAGGNHNLALLSDGTVLSWGGNVSGQCGKGGTPTAFELPGLVMDASGLNPLTGVTMVAAGVEHSLAILDGNVWAWGDNVGMQAGLAAGFFTTLPNQIQAIAPGTYLEKVISISAGAVHNMALDVNGNVWTWGRGFNGQLGIGPIIKSFPPSFTTHLAQNVADSARTISAGWYHSTLVDSRGELWVFGFNNRGQLTGAAGFEQFSPLNTGFTKNVGLAAGHQFTLSLLSDGSLTGTGAGTEGQIGISFLDRNVLTGFDSVQGKIAVLATQLNSYMLKADGSVWVTGDHVGLGMCTTADTLVEIQNIYLSDIIAIAGTDHSAFALDVYGNVWGWGDNGFGEIGQGTYGSVSEYLCPQVIGVTDIVHIEGSVQGGFSGNGDHVNAITVGGDLFAWGANDQFKLGDATTTTRDVPIAITAITDIFSSSLGSYNTFILHADNTVQVWGNKSTSGSTSSSYNKKLPQLIDFGTVDRYKEISSSRRTTMGLLTDGTIKVWGGKTNNAPNFFSTTSSSASNESPSPAIVYESPSSAAVLSNAKAINMGDNFASLVKADGMCWLWGQNKFGQLGRRTFTSEETTPAIDSLQLASPNILFKSVNSEHQVLANQSNEWIYTWGIGEVLADGSTSDNAEATQNMRMEEDFEEDLKKLTTAILYPNPASDMVYFTFPEVPDGPVSLTIHALDGKSITQKVSDPKDLAVSFEVSDLERGYYLYQLSDGRYKKRGRLIIK